MKNIQVIDGATNSVYDIFAATDDEFALIFAGDEDVAFIDEVMARGPAQALDEAFEHIWKRRIPKRAAMGIHGLLFYQLEEKKPFYPTRKDEEARNPDGSRLRQCASVTSTSDVGLEGMKADQLAVGRAYFMCGYFFRNRPIPEIETWIYVGPESDEQGQRHRFQDPIAYYPGEYAQEVPDGESVELPEAQVITVRDEDIELVYDLSGLEEFVAGLRSEPNSNETF